ncbi:rod shape-determining protein RodA [Sulfurimicrobium lacus]|uniref:Peptidoglycan glycosyltransferase MrdB n=1 Tax=Sulfurimicrobium lacus TaxID=2715678 RepID=A0A6F8VFQ3_9PROT|nr:rod shape-determining protein RodA [Sulfurimicrobium lacus]BCB28653.1 rod shape-determining protein RodA [Sulfurimicrobium lacus]
MIRRLFIRLVTHLDGYLLLALAMIMLLGLVVLYSAAGEDFHFVTRQLVNLSVALGVMWLVANIPPQHLARLGPPVYVIGLLLLLGVAMFGEISHGARRWLYIGVTRIQPSEIMKIAVPLMLAWYFDRRAATLRFKDFVIAAALLLIPVVLIAKQPDLGTALIVSAAGFYVLFLGGLSWRVLIGLAVAGAASLPLLWSMLHDYQRQRVLTLLDPSQDPLGAGYHTLQSTIAMGSGGIFGKGWLHGTQAHLEFIPERHTDFILAVLGEEFGLFGGLVLLVLYLLVIGRGLAIAANAPTLFGRLFAGSIVLTFFTYAFVNVGMVSGILPVVGVPLPLVSYGGTSAVTLLFGMGALMSIQTHRKLVKT